MNCIKLILVLGLCLCLSPEKSTQEVEQSDQTPALTPSPLSGIQIYSVLGAEYNAVIEKINAAWHEKTGQQEMPTVMLDFVFERVFPNNMGGKDGWVRALESIGKDSIDTLVEHITTFVKRTDLTFINLAEKVAPIHEVIRQECYSSEYPDPEISNLSVIEVAKMMYTDLQFIQFLYDLTEPIRVAASHIDEMTKPNMAKLIWKHFIDESVLTKSASMNFYLRWRTPVLTNKQITHDQFNQEEFNEIRGKIVSFLKFLQTCYENCTFMQAVGKLLVLTGTREDEYSLTKAQSDFLVEQIMYTKPYEVSKHYIALSDGIMKSTDAFLVTFPFLQPGRYKVEEYTGSYKVGRGPSLLKIRFIGDEPELQSEPFANSSAAVNTATETTLTQE